MPLWQVINTITVSLEANCDFATGSIITFSGLSGSITPDGVLPVVGSANNSLFQWLESPAAWYNAGNLTVVSTAYIFAETVYAFQFNVTNGAIAQPSSDWINVSGTVEAGPIDADVVSKSMEKPHLELIGVANGTDPLLIIEPVFEVFYMQQSSPLWYVINTITVSMKANCNLLPGSTITISGLTGSVSDDTDLRVVPSSTDLDGSGVWLRDPGNLTLISLGTTQQLSYIYRFNLTNPPNSQPAPNVSVSGTIEVGPLDAPVTIRPVEVRSDFLISVERGTEPMLVIEPNFTAYAVGHSSPIALASNFISVTLQANCDFAARSFVTVSGLTGAVYPTITTVDFVSEPANLFVEPSGSWNVTTGEFTSVVDTVPILANTTYVITFELRNGAVEQDSPAISIAASIEAGLIDAPVFFKLMTIPAVYDLKGVINGSNPLQIVEPLFIVKDIGQSNPLVLASNLISITMQTNCDLAWMTNFTVSGLKGAGTQDTMSLHEDPYFTHDPPGILAE
eukprot:1473080-Rhodomonas_salina.1